MPVRVHVINKFVIHRPVDVRRRAIFSNVRQVSTVLKFYGIFVVTNEIACFSFIAYQLKHVQNNNISLCLFSLCKYDDSGETE